MKTVYISIGNTDNKLTQQEWASLNDYTRTAIDKHANTIHGSWQSIGSDPWQNACWCIEVTPWNERALTAELKELAGLFRQDSIAWAEATTTFINPDESD